MKYKCVNMLFILLAVFFISCSSANERMISGKWILAGRMVGDFPSSFWFKSSGSVIAPWETRGTAKKSEGDYDFPDDTHIMIKMNSGYYQGNVYYYEIIQLDKEKLILRSDVQDIKLRKI